MEQDAPYDTTLQLETEFDPAYGHPVKLAPAILRVTGRNPSPFTFFGTNCYVIGRERCVVVDPGPDIDEHRDAVLAAIDGRSIDAILLTHTHRDHTGLVPFLKHFTGAPVIGGGPHRPARAHTAGEAKRLDAAGDTAVAFDRTLGDGEKVETGDLQLTAIATPGHCANHIAYEIGNTGTVLSGDHVMAWSTTIVAPPDGAMHDYMASLEKLLSRNDELYLPGHGAPLARPQRFVRALIAHRRMREAAILKQLESGERTIEEIVAVLYHSTDRRLHGAAGLSVLAHLEDLIAHGAVTCSDSAEGPDRFRLA